MTTMTTMTDNKPKTKVYWLSRDKGTANTTYKLFKKRPMNVSLSFYGSPIYEGRDSQDEVHSFYYRTFEKLFGFKLKPGECIRVSLTLPVFTRVPITMTKRRAKKLRSRSK